MKRIFTVFIFLMLGCQVYGQVAASATWALTSNGAPAIVGSVAGGTITPSTSTNFSGYPDYAFQSGGLAVSDGASLGAWLNDGTSPTTNSTFSGIISNTHPYYVEFNIAPSGGANLSVTSISIPLAITVNFATIYYAVAWSTDNFATINFLGGTTSAGLSLATGNRTATVSYSTPITVNNGTTLKVRVIAWRKGSTTTNTPFVIGNTVISGTTTSTSAPSTQPTFSAFSNIGTTTLTSTWSAGNGVGRVVYMNSSNSFTDPTDGTTPTASTAWANAGQQCIYNGTGTTVNITGLSAGTTYYFRAYEFNGSGASTLFQKTAPASTSQATTIVPVTQSSSIGFSPVGTTSFTINWTSGSGAGRIVRLNTTNSFTNPSNGTSYSGSAAYVSGEQTVYNGSGNSIAITGLSQGITYYVEIFEYNGTGTGITYNTTSPAAGSQATSVNPPAAQPTFSGFTNISTTTLTVNWSIGDGAGRVVYISNGSSFTDPSNGTSPSASAAYSGSGQQCILNGTGTTVNVTGLTAGTTYYFHAYEYNGSGATITYLLTAPASTSQATTIVPVTQSSAINFSPVAPTSMTINWTSGSGANRIVRVNSSNSFVPPVDGTSYTANAAYTSGERTVYNGSGNSVAITGLSQGTTYYVEIFEYNGTGTGIVYNTTSPAAGNQTTTVNPPSTQPTFTAFTNLGTASLTTNWTVGNGAGRAIYISDGATFTDPSTGVSPTANTVYSGTGQQCIYLGTGTNTVGVTGLTAGTTYYFHGYEYNGGGATITYLTTTPASTSTATVTVPTTQSSAINFTTISAAGMTINWTSGNGANRIVRVNTTNSFSSPVDGTSYSANSVYTSGEKTVYNGTGATVSITGLSPATTYYVEIYEYSGTGTGIVYLTTSPASGSQITSDASVSTDYFRSAVTGNWSATATWQSSHDSTTWNAATLVPTNAAKSITIVSGHTITVDVAETAVNLIIDGTVTATVAPTLTAGYNLVRNGGKYTYVYASGVAIPLFTWQTGSTCELTGAFTAAPTNSNQSFYNVTINGGGTTPNLSGGMTTVNGTLSVKSTGGGTNGLRLFTRGTSGTLTCGALDISAGKLEIIGGGTASATTGTLTVLGDVNISGGTLSFGNNNNASAISVLNVGGNFSMSGTAYITDSNTTSARLNFTKTGTQTFSKTGGFIWATTNGIKITVNSGSTLDMGTSILNNSVLTNTAFTLSSGAGLIIGDANGISTSGATGNIQVTGTRSFSTGADYTYAGSSAQVTGNGIMNGVNNLTINNSAGVTLTGSVSYPVNGTLTVTSGDLSTGTSYVTLGSTATLTETGSNIVYGDIRTTRTVAQSTNNTFGGIGAEINASGAAPGSTVLRRVTGTTAIRSGNSNSSIKRYYVITPTTNSGLNATLVFHYNDRADELNGLSESDLLLWKSADGSTDTWSIGGFGTADANANTVTISGLSDFSVWTLGSGASPLPVELTSFTANVSGKNVILKWATATEVNNSYFTVERTKQSVLKNWKEVARVNGAGNSNSPKNYSFTDMVSESGDYTYRLVQHDNDGTKQIMMETSAKVSIPLEFTLEQNYPNPFNPSTDIHYSVPEDTRVNISVFAVTGQLIKTLVDEYQSAGYHTIRMDASKMSSGTYIYQMNAGNTKLTKKLVILK